MFGEQFYPTPKEVIIKMLEPYSGEIWKGGINGYNAQCKCAGLEDKTILEPSAGKGDIIKFIQEELHNNARRSKCDVYAIELDPNLSSILKENEISVIGSDFLSYQNDIYFDVILMNPPFKNGADHLLKAIEIAHNTDIVCLLNAETLLNPSNKKKQLLLEKIEKYGSYEILGNVFSTAERKTDVNVALVRLHIETETQTFDFSFKDYEPNKIEFDESFIKDELARKDLIGNMMLQFEQSKAAYKEYIEAEAKWLHMTKNLLSIHTNLENYDKKSFKPIKRYNFFNNRIKANMWRTVIQELNLERYMTSNVQQNFNIFIQQQGHMSFTKENVKALFEMLVFNSKNILEQSIIDVFDMLTANYYSENRLHVQGWKTNDRYKINRKIIAPTYIRYGEYMSSWDIKQYGDRFSLSYNGSGKYTDIDKMLCYLSGKQYETIITIQQALENKFRFLGKIKTGEKYDNTCLSTFFEIKFYKKGTVHLKFRDTFLWNEFNMRACNGKNWLPDNERRQWEANYKRNQKKHNNNPSSNELQELPVNTSTAKENPIKKTNRKPKKSSEFQNQLFELFVPNM